MDLYDKIIRFKYTQDEMEDRASTELPLIRIKENPGLNGLVLAGGKSLRMGTDKGLLNWHHDQGQRYYTADLLKTMCSEVFISCRPDQVAEMDPGYLTVRDICKDIGPFSGVLSAFQQKPNEAWLVIACDFPLLDLHSIHYLIGQRNKIAIATAYENPSDNKPEPLFCIWEPAVYPLLLADLEKGYCSLRKLLMNNSVQLIRPLNPVVLTNINTPEELQQVKNKH
jgi:molybdopterin-guanine dinucleotide biosynthesis protein A